MHTFVILAYKESSYLEDCILSTLNQIHSSTIVIATSTPNTYIQNLASKYNLKVFINPNSNGIGSDFDFALNCIQSPLVTIAHQDDIYMSNYSQSIVDNYLSHPNSTILFSDYYEIKNNNLVESNLNLIIKRLLLFPLRIPYISNTRFIKRRVLSLGCPICCPAVTFVPQNLSKPHYFTSSFKCDVDWFAWEQISTENGCFSFIPKKLMGHRVHAESTTSDIINNNQRLQEDYKMFCKFWPNPIANALIKIYKYSERSNHISEA